MGQDQRVFTVAVFAPGGSRGIIPAVLVDSLERKTGQHATEMFDMMCCISSGTITAGILNRRDPRNPEKPLYWGRDAVRLYDDFTPVVFPKTGLRAKYNMMAGKGLYDPAPYEEKLRQLMGDARIGDSITNLIMLGTAIDRRKKAAWIKHFKNEPDTSKAAWSTLRWSQAIRALTTVPFLHPIIDAVTYPEGQPPLIHNLMDGYQFAGSFMHAIHMEAKRIAPPGAKIVIAYFGTGITELQMDAGAYNGGVLSLRREEKRELFTHLHANAPLQEGLRHKKTEMGDELLIFDGVINQEKNPHHPSPDLANGTKEQNHALKMFAREIETKECPDDFGRLQEIVKHRKFVEDRHQRSRTPFGKIQALFEQAHTAYDAVELQMRIEKYCFNRDTLPPRRDRELWQSCRNLNMEHTQQIIQMAATNVKLKEHQSQLANAGKKMIHEIREAGQEIIGVAQEKQRDITENIMNAAEATREVFSGKSRRKSRQRLRTPVSGNVNISFNRDDLPGGANDRGMLPSVHLSVRGEEATDIGQANPKVPVAQKRSAHANKAG